ncbi:purine and uridine phosphorylase, partial [Aureobasidium melanogenum]
MLPKTRDDFEVAIICALPLEAAAVLDSFDDRYDKNGSKYGKQDGDINTYSTGRIGRHNVVLAHMPGMGISSAARVASNIQLSFKGIRLALLVGVCGGAPLERPTPAIVLGDVIVSNSVVEFDFGRQYPDRFERKTGLADTLGRPNTEIRGLLSMLKIETMREELEETILQNLAKLQEKRHTAKYPGADHDKLFPASYRHIHRRETASQDCPCVSSQSNSNASCSEALESNCDTLGCVVDVLDSPSRQTRFASGAPTPFVHIGTIGSASTVMKSGEHRDSIARKDDIIAFEMEGAGVWDNFPCVVIKGVCDYADSHKNKIWQDYAAATAASTAKAFLDYWTSRRHNTISGEGSSRKRRRSLSSDDDLNASKGARRAPHQERQDAALSALRPTDHISTGSRPPSASVNPDLRKSRLDALIFEQLDARHATIKDAHAATCEWLLSKSEYLDWQSEDKVPQHHGFLWIKGKPGAGKSTIIKFAYTNAKKKVRGPVVISYFFNARGESLEKSTIGMYRSLLFQLLSDVPRLQEVLDTNEAIELQSVPSDLWPTETLQLLFRRAIEKLENQRLTCFIDALDECENNEDQVREMVHFFEALGERATMSKTRFHVCFSSRHYPHITIDKCVELVLEAQQGHSEDITKYINSRLKVGRSKRAEQIKSEVRENAQGIFLWVILVVPMLQKAYDHGRVHALSECLRGLPKGLNELFEDMLRRDADHMENLKSCLRWILYAARPLSPEELYFAIFSTSSSASATIWNPEDVTFEDIKRFILSSSKGLAETTRSKTPTVQFIHESVRDFLLKEGGPALQADISLASAGLVHDFLKHSCQRYLISIPTDNIEEISKKTKTIFPFLKYSIRYVFKHAETAAGLGISQEQFLDDFPLQTWILLHDSTEDFKTRRYGSGVSLLYILVEQDLLHLFRIEVCRSKSINDKGGRYDFPIIAAAVVGNEQILELLLLCGADHTRSCKDYRHALHAAVDKSHAPAVAMLIDHGAVPCEIPDKLFMQTTRRRDFATMKLLLENGLGPALCSDTKPLVETVINNEDQRMLRLFLVFGLIGVDASRVLHQVSSLGNYALVCTLVDFGVNVNTASVGDTALGAASRSGHEAVVRLLLEEGACVNALHVAFYETTTALCSASLAGRDTVVCILLEHGADANMECPLVAASLSGHETITRTLLEHGADPNQGKIFIYSNTTRLPLHVALERGKVDIVRLLLDHGADVNISSCDYTNAFSALNSCRDPQKRVACEQLLQERNSARPQTPTQPGSMASTYSE